MKNELMITLPSSLQSKQDKIASQINGFGGQFTHILSKYQKSFGIEKAVTEKAPTFHDFAKLCGEDAVKFWLRLQIFMAFDFVGISLTASEYQIRETADLIIADEIYGQLTLAEFMCFITKFKRGYFGKIYQSQRPNPQEFLQCLQPFWNELSYERGKQAERERQEQISRERHSPDNISWLDYCAETGRNPNDNPLSKINNKDNPIENVTRSIYTKTE